MPKLYKNLQTASTFFTLSPWAFVLFVVFAHLTPLKECSAIFFFCIEASHARRSVCVFFVERIVERRQ